jgi:hypothetical protein
MRRERKQAIRFDRRGGVLFYRGAFGKTVDHIRLSQGDHTIFVVVAFTDRTEWSVTPNSVPVAAVALVPLVTETLATWSLSPTGAPMMSRRLAMAWITEPITCARLSSKLRGLSPFMRSKCVKATASERPAFRPLRVSANESALAGFWTWKNFGRSAKGGQKGIRILPPIVGVRRKKDPEANKDITKQNERVLVGFRNAYVFERLSRDLRPRFYAPMERAIHLDAPRR